MNKAVVKTIYQTRVFSVGPGGGNPRPVLLHADGFSAQQARGLAAEFTAETILIGPPSTFNADFRLRYFVPRYEMEMCLHATIAAVTVLHTTGQVSKSPVVFETALGLISVDWTAARQILSATVNQFPPQYAPNNPTAAEAAAVLGLPANAAIRDDLPLQTVSTSRPKLLVPLDSVNALDHLQPDFEALWELCDQFKTTGLYPLAVRGSAGSRLSARQFPNRAGYNEDPATGVAACALAAYLTCYLSKEDGWHSYEIHQGEAIGRPSRLMALARMHENQVTHTSVSGDAEILSQESYTIAG